MKQPRVRVTQTGDGYTYTARNGVRVYSSVPPYVWAENSPTLSLVVNVVGSYVMWAAKFCPLFKPLERKYEVLVCR